MPLSWNEIRNRAIAFSSEWADETSESAEAKTFWDQFFKVFGVSRKRIATFEKRVEKLDGANGYIDLFWPGILVAEHKSRGKDLDRAYTQAIDYFHGLKDEELPRYVIVSDFEKFRVHDLEEDIETEFSLSELPDRINDFGFIAGYEKRKFREQDPVNIKAADKLAKLHDGLLEIGYGGHDLEVYLVRILFCLFAEDTGIFSPRGAFYDFIDQRTSEDGSDLAARLNELFEVLNTPEEQRLTIRDEQVNSFPYINGGLFKERLRTAAFDTNLRRLLIECCEIDWGRVSPAIFGSLFQGIMDKDARRNLGAHYTSEQNIMKVISPLFLDNLKEELDKCGKNKNKLNAFHEKLENLNFFDPACGCGNFLVITYREIRLLELEVIRRLYGKHIKTLHLLDVIDNYVKVDVDQFHGIEIEEWPSQIARVAMWLIDHQMNEMVSVEFGNVFVRIPLIKSANIFNDNALRVDWGDVVSSLKCSYIIGNPPFNGAKTLTKAQTSDRNHASKGIKNYGTLDFVCGWYVKAIKYIRGTKICCALVSTNSITQGEQVGNLFSYLFDQGIKINFGHRTFKWRNEAKGVAAVHCVIIGFSLHDKAEKIIYEYPNYSGEPIALKSGNINPYLVDGPNTLAMSNSKPICDVPKSRIGNKPIDGGHYLFTTEEKENFISIEPKSKPLFKKWVGSKEFINGIDRWVLWLGDCTSSELRSMPEVIKIIERVKKVRLGEGPNKKGKMPKKDPPDSTKVLANRPTRFHVETIPQKDYLIIPGVSSAKRTYIPIGYLGRDTFSSNLVNVILDADIYHFGILCSNMHMAWVRTVCGRLKSDYRYSNSIVYNNFIWPEPTSAQRSKIEKTAKQILDARLNHPEATLADLYDPLAMPSDLRKAHQANDKAVDAAYGKRKFKTEAERVGYLFELYKDKIS